MPPVPLDDPAPRRLREYCFAWTDDFGGVPVTADTRAALEKLAETLAGLGCCVERHSPPGFDFEAAWQAYGEIFGTMVGVGMPFAPRMMGHLLGPIMYKDEPGYRAVMRGVGLNMQRYVVALSHRDALIESMERFLAEWDAWLCPVSSTPAFTHRKPATKGPGQPIEVDGQQVPYWVGSVSHTSVLNLTGNPVVVLPLDRSRDGLPIGVQVVGKRWRDVGLLAIAEQLEKVTGRFQRPPGY